VIAAGAIRPCEVPIRTVVTSVSDCFPGTAPLAEMIFYFNAFQQSSSNWSKRRINEGLRLIMEFLS
jgi:hypothetical protein